MRICVDMDCVLADFNSAVIEYFNKLGFTPSNRFYQTYKVSEWYEGDPDEIHRLFVDLMGTRNFWMDLAPIPDAVETVRKLKRLGHEIIVATVPWWSSEVSAYEKWAWVNRHFRRILNPFECLVFSTRKYLIEGDILIDDRPKHLADWLDHRPYGIVYDYPYNRDYRALPRDAYRAVNWEDVLRIVEEEIGAKTEERKQ